MATVPLIVAGFNQNGSTRAESLAFTFSALSDLLIIAYSHPVLIRVCDYRKVAGRLRRCVDSKSVWRIFPTVLFGGGDLEVD